MKNQRDKLTRLLYSYKDLNSTDLENLPYTDLYVHRVRLKEGTKPFSRPKQRRWPPGKEFWMKRIISDDWNALAQLVDNSDKPGCFVESKCHNYLGHPEHKIMYFRAFQ
ncbi:hypothetical protein OnM2_077082 [Erysiphe neolycopersici]|uniref:Uncharacterized protein n=1 Tax=Erysiphe neolycopersici TaxID=212602 RepID=A0A420HHW1_9PEZI|nr:hypothetical protein OnM2_077082 [Erysiphe neolycopersici]